MKPAASIVLTAVVLVSVFVAFRAGSAIGQEDPSQANAKPITDLLSSDGSLKSGTGFSGSVNTAGYKMLTGPGGEPRFLPAQRLVATSEDLYWSDKFAANDTDAFDMVLADNGDLYIAGGFTSVGGVACNHIAKWDGSAWSPQGLLQNFVYALATDGSNIYVGGGSGDTYKSDKGFVSQLNGEAWSQISLGTNNPVYALAVDNGLLYAGGTFTRIGGVVANRVAKWDGASWSPLGAGMNGTVYALAVNGGNVYAGGTFTTAGGISAKNVAKWDGSQWSSLGTSVNNRVNALAMIGDALLVGGDFTTAGGKPSAYFANWMPRVNRSSLEFEEFPGQKTLGDDEFGYFSPALITSPSAMLAYEPAMPVTITMKQADEIQVEGKRINGALSLSPSGVDFGDNGATLAVEFSEDDAAAFNAQPSYFRAAELVYPSDYPTNKEASETLILSDNKAVVANARDGRKIYRITAPIRNINSVYGAVPVTTDTPSNTPTVTPTETPFGNDTATPSDTPTETPTSTATNTVTPTNTFLTPLPTDTPTNTPVCEGFVWRTRTPMLTPCSVLACAVVADKIYTFASISSGGNVEVYDPAEDTWANRTRMPTPRAGFGCETVGGKIYCFGGFAGFDVDTVQMYDPETDAWIYKEPLLAFRRYLGSAQVDGKIYAIGGLYSSTRLKTVEMYDPDGDVWYPKASMQTARANFACAVVDGKIYAMGGWTGSQYLSSVEMYDPGTNTWTPKSPMPEGRYSFACGVVDGKIYVIGGRTAAGNQNTVVMYDPSTDTWSAKSPMTTARFNLGCAVLGESIYAIGGTLNFSLGYDIVEEYKPLCDVPTPTYTPSETPTDTPTPTITPTDTSTPTPSNTPTATNTPTYTPSETPTDTPTSSPSMTSTPSSTSTETPTPPETLLYVVDNSDPGFSMVGSWLTGTSASGRYGTNYRYNLAGTGTKKATWQLTIPKAGVYSVSVWYPNGTNPANNAPYTVNSADGAHNFRINQGKRGGGWNLLGQFAFNQGPSTVVLSDDAQQLKTVFADAVKWSQTDATATATNTPEFTATFTAIFTPTDSPTDTPISADWNHDGNINSLDLSHFYEQWGSNGQDLNGDGVFDSLDLFLFSVQWNP